MKEGSLTEVCQECCFSVCSKKLTPKVQTAQAVRISKGRWPLIISQGTSELQDILSGALLGLETEWLRSVTGMLLPT